MKLLICDDDISTIDVLQNQIDCQEFGISRIFRAYNGEVAMEIIAKELPELILCDIEMPKNTGLDVLKFIYNEELPCELAFITCFESFEFAKEAVKYGASTYLVKPLDFNEVRETLKKMIDSVSRKKQAQSPHVQDMVTGSILRQIRDGNFGTNREQIDFFLKRNNMHFTAESRWHLVEALANVQEAVQSGWERDTLNFSFNRILVEKISDMTETVYSFQDHREHFERITCLVPAGWTTENGALQLCREIIHIAKEFLNLEPVFLVDADVPLGKLASECAENEKKIYAVRMHQGSVFTADLALDAESSVPSLNEEQMTRCLKEHDRNSFMQRVKDYTGRIMFEKKLGERMMRNCHIQLIEICRKFMEDNDISGTKLIEDVEMSKVSRDAELSISDLLRFAGVLYDRSMYLLENTDNLTDAVDIVKDYIRKHYKEDINRDDVAGIAYVTPNYLSKLFRQRIGMNMREYINLLRINEAKRLLISTDENISDIANDLGYNNISYFSTVFHKSCGMSPAEWRAGNEKAD